MWALGHEARPAESARTKAWRSGQCQSGNCDIRQQGTKTHFRHGRDVHPTPGKSPQLTAPPLRFVDSISDLRESWQGTRSLHPPAVTVGERIWIEASKSPLGNLNNAISSSGLYAFSLPGQGGSQWVRRRGCWDLVSLTSQLPSSFKALLPHPQPQTL